MPYIVVLVGKIYMLVQGQSKETRQPKIEANRAIIAFDCIGNHEGREQVEDEAPVGVGVAEEGAEGEGVAEGEFEGASEGGVLSIGSNILTGGGDASGGQASGISWLKQWVQTPGHPHGSGTWPLELQPNEGKMVSLLTLGSPQRSNLF